MATQQLAPATLNGLSPDDLRQLISSVRADPANAKTHWEVATRWQSGTASQTRVTACQIAGQTITKDFTLNVDEPLELGGTNAAPNPQEYLLAALNACMTVGYVAGATLMGIKLKSLEIRSQGDIDLRGFLGLDPKVKPGYESIRYTVHLSADAPDAVLRKLHETVCATSPNRFNLSTPIPLTADLVIH